MPNFVERDTTDRRAVALVVLVVFGVVRLSFWFPFTFRKENVSKFSGAKNVVKRPWFSV
jgi:hypothetical protein